MFPLYSHFATSTGGRKKKQIRPKALHYPQNKVLDGPASAAHLSSTPSPLTLCASDQAFLSSPITWCFSHCRTFTCTVPIAENTPFTWPRSPVFSLSLTVTSSGLYDPPSPFTPHPPTSSTEVNASTITNATPVLIPNQTLNSESQEHGFLVPHSTRCAQNGTWHGGGTQQILADQ